MNKYYVNFVFVVIICCPIVALAQQLDDLKKQNTFFILFEEGEFATKKQLRGPEKPIKYQFYKNQKNKSDKTPYDFVFYHAEFFNAEESTQGERAAIKYKLHKSFLKKNKDIILTREEIESIGDSAMIRLFNYNKRNLFIIDKSEAKNNYILVREVRLITVLME